MQPNRTQNLTLMNITQTQSIKTVLLLTVNRESGWVAFYEIQAGNAAGLLSTPKPTQVTGHQG